MSLTFAALDLPVPNSPFLPGIFVDAYGESCCFICRLPLRFSPVEMVKIKSLRPQDSDPYDPKEGKFIQVHASCAGWLFNRPR